MLYRKSRLNQYLKMDIEKYFRWKLNGFKEYINWFFLNSWNFVFIWNIFQYHLIFLIFCTFLMQNIKFFRQFYSVVPFTLRYNCMLLLHREGNIIRQIDSL